MPVGVGAFGLFGGVAAGGGGTPYDLALEFDGANGSTTFPDTSGNGLTAVAAGDAQITTTTPKFGTGALLLDGTGDWVTMSGVTGVGAWGTGEGTVAFWLRLADVTTTQVLFDTRASGGGANQSALTLYVTGGNLYAFATGANRITGTATLSTATWYHVAWSRDGSGNARMFVDGTQDGSTYADGTTYVGASGRPIIGANGDNTANNTNGRFDSLIVASTALYTANFTPPTGAYT